jgi:hypothetical protein
MLRKNENFIDEKDESGKAVLDGEKRLNILFY